LLAAVAVIFVSVCLLTSPETREEAPPEEELLWNLEMKVTDVTPTDLTVEFIQHGEFPGSEGAVLRYGNGYILQVNRGGEWVDVEILSHEESTTWNLVAFPIDLNGTSICYVNWSLRHGQLPTGHYRIGKAVTLFRAAGDYDEQTFHAEFIVYEDTAWEMDLTGEEYLEMCRDAVAEFQSRENYHVRETLVRWISDRDAGREYAAYWRCGDDWARQFYIPVTEEMFSHLCYQGGFFSRYQQEDGSGTWKAANGTDCGTYSEPWLSRLDWDAQKIAFRHVEQVGELLHIYATVYAAPEFKGYEDAEQYDMGFFFDKDGNLHTAMMGYLEGDVQMISDLRIENTLEANIREKLDQIAADRFAETAE
jgi:hypothetical protein